MKLIQSSSVLIILAFNVVSLNAQREISAVTRSNPYDKMIHFNPLPLLIGGFEMGFEKATTHKESIYTQLCYYTSKDAGLYDLKSGNYSNLNGVKIDLQYRFYRKTNNYVKNVWIAPFLNFKTISLHYEEEQITYGNIYPYTTTRTKINENRMATTLSFGYMMGMRKYIFENIYVDYSLGGGIYIPVAGDNHGQLNIPFIAPYQRGVQLRFNLGFCIAL